MSKRRRKLRPSGGYRKLASFQTATIIYDATVWFCERFVNIRPRMVDQMVQGARSGRQNIAEGSRASATSSQTELRLVNVARSSLDELLLDYEDYLRQRHLVQWDPEGPEAGEVRGVPERYRRDRSDQSDLTDLNDQQRWALYSPWLDHAVPAVRANALICLIHQTNYLLDGQIAALEEAFVEEGGYSEQLAMERMRRRGREQLDPTDPSDRTDQSDLGKIKPPACPTCGGLMALRTAKRTGSQFWGCARYPGCTGTAKL